MSPSNADFGKSELFKELATSRAAIYTYVLGGGATFLAGAWMRSPLEMAAGPAVVVAVVLLVALVRADRIAAHRFYVNYASSVGLTHWPRYHVTPITPLLGAGDRRWCEHWMAGTLPGQPGFSGGIGHLVFQEVEREDGRERATSTRRFTVCVVDLEPSLPFFKGLYVRRRRGVFPEGKDWVGKSDSRSIELESSHLTDRYEVRIASDQSEVRARQLLAPSLVAWLGSHPLAPCFEVKAGTLVVYVPRVIEDAGNLTFMLDAARHIATRVLLETDDALERHGRTAELPQPGRGALAAEAQARVLGGLG